jgi:hypothetical protein
MNFYEKILSKKVTGVYHNYSLQKLSILFENGLTIEFDGCVIVFDLGIVGHTINYISNNGTLGLIQELKKNHLNPEDYKSTTLSRDIDDFENKNEMIVAYKNVSILNSV